MSLVDSSFFSVVYQVCVKMSVKIAQGYIKMKKYPHTFIIKLTDEQQKYLNKYALHGGRNSHVRGLIDSDMRLEQARGVGLTAREMDIFIKESNLGS